MSYAESTAVIDGPYRYRLVRVWEPGRPKVLWIMLNPSTADAMKDDPTIRRCVGFTKRWGYGGIEVCNLFAYRATDPADLEVAHLRGIDVVGPANDAEIRACAADKGAVVAGWGTQGDFLERALKVRLLLNRAGYLIQCLGRTKGGHPRHPLYVGRDVPLIDL